MCTPSPHDDDDVFLNTGRQTLVLTQTRGHTKSLRGRVVVTGSPSENVGVRDPFRVKGSISTVPSLFSTV